MRISLFLRIGGDDRHGEPEIRTLAGCGFHTVFRVVRDQDILDDRKPQTGADLGAAVFLRNAIIAIPDVFQVFFADAFAVIDDLDADAFVLHRLAHDDGLIFADIIDRIVDQVVQHLRDAQLIAHDEHLFLMLKGNDQPVVLDQLGVAGKNALDTLCQRERRLFDVGGVALQA